LIGDPDFFLLDSRFRGNDREGVCGMTNKESHGNVKIPLDSASSAE